METRRVSGLSWGHIIACAVILIIFVMFMIMHTSANSITTGRSIGAVEPTEEIPLLSKDFDSNLELDIKEESLDIKDEVLEPLVSENEVEAGPKEEVAIEESEIDNYITTYLDDIKFLCYTFSIDYEDFVDDLYKQYDKYHETYGFNEKRYLKEL